MDTRTTVEYRKFRAAGFRASYALRAARTLIQWDTLEACQLVSLKAIPDECAELEEGEYEYAEAWGVYGVAGFYTTGKDEISQFALDNANSFKDMESLGFESADSIWGCIYENPTNPFENDYVVDIMEQTIDALKTALKSRPVVFHFRRNWTLTYTPDLVAA